MNQMVVVDTDILIDAGRSIEEALTCLQKLEQEKALSISVVTQMELMVGCRNKKEYKALEGFIKRFRVLKITEAVSDKAVSLLRTYRLSHGLLIPDALIAATAMCLDCSMISKNQHDYRFIKGLQLLSYPAP